MLLLLKAEKGLGVESVVGDNPEKHSRQGQGYGADVSPAWCPDGEGRPGTMRETWRCVGNAFVGGQVPDKGKHLSKAGASAWCSELLPHLPLLTINEPAGHNPHPREAYFGVMSLAHLICVKRGQN